jgi:hypothetical protein
MLFLEQTRAEGHIQIANTDFGCRPHTVSCLGCKPHDPWARIIDVDLGVSRMYSWEGDAVPSK